MSQLGISHSDIVLPPPTPTEPYPDFPVEVDDQYILTHQILGQPDHSLSLLSGFNQAVKIYMTMNGLVGIEMTYGISKLPFHDQKAMLDESLQSAKQTLEGLPPQLAIDLDRSGSGPSHGLSNLVPTAQQANVFEDTSNGLQYGPIGYSPLQQHQQQATPDFRHTPSVQPERRRLLQYEIQQANIYASQISTRSYYVERYLNLRDAHRDHARAQAAQASFSTGGTDSGNGTDQGDNNTTTNKSVAAAALHAVAEQTDPIDANMTAERELIVQHLLTVLTSISQRSMEPNGASFINKIRQVASTLVHDERKGPVAVNAQESLSKFVEVLLRLERIPPGDHGNGGVGNLVGAGQDEEQELRSWADLRENQFRFLQGGGFMGLP